MRDKQPGFVALEPLEARTFLAADVADEYVPVPGWNLLPQAFADFNGDAIRDLLGHDGTSWSLRLGTPAGYFEPASMLPIIGRPYGEKPAHGQVVTTGDFTGDGDLDIVIVRGTAADTGVRLWLLRGRGDGSFSRDPSILIPDLAMPAMRKNREAWSASLDGPSEPLSLVLRFKSGIFALKPAEAGAVPPATFRAAGLTVLGIADFHQDGRDEVVIRTGNTITALGGGDGGALEPVVVATEVLAPEVILGDARGDEWPALLYIRSGVVTQVRSALAPGGSGVPDGFDVQPLTTLQSPLPNAAVAAAGEINGDGRPDLVIASGYIQGGRIPSYVLNGYLLLSAPGGGYSLRWSDQAYGGYAVGSSSLRVLGYWTGRDLAGDGLMDVFGPRGALRSLPEGLNTRPSVESVTVTEPDSLSARRTVYAAGVSDDGTVARVEFWFDRDDNGVLDSSDMFISLDRVADSDGRYQRLLRLEHTYGGSGRRRFFDMAVDTLGFRGPATSVEVDFA